MADPVSIAGNKLIPISEIGMPYHGLATDGVLTKPSGDKTINNPGLFGACIVVRHPQAPGADRNTNELLHDAAQGLEWRNYALLTNIDHGINGSVGIGSEKWLYCDAGGNTWVIAIEKFEPGTSPPQVTHEGIPVDHIGTPVTHTGTLANDEVEYYIWLDAIFGRSGKFYPHERRFLASLTFQPTIPSWYGGPYSAADVAPILKFRPESIAPNADGSSAYIHIFMNTAIGGGFDIAQKVYREAQPYVNNQDFTQSTGEPMLGVLKVDLTGIGDINSNGLGVTATLALDMEYEADLILERTAYFNSSDGVKSEDIIQTNSLDCPIPDTPEGSQETTWVPNYTLQTGDPSGFFGRTGFEFKTIMYKSFTGLVTQKYIGYESTDWSVTYDGGINDSFNLNNDSNAGNPLFLFCDSAGRNNWYCLGCTQSGYYYENLQQDDVFRLSIEYDVYGEVEKNEYIEIDRLDRRSAITDFTPAPPYGPCGVGCPRPPPDESSSRTDVITINDQPLNSASRIYFEIHTAAPNCHYTAVDIPQNPDPTTRDLLEDYVTVSEAGTVVRKLEKVTPHPPIPAGRPIPNDRELVWSYQPVTDEFVSGQTTLFQAHTGPLYQYV